MTIVTPEEALEAYNKFGSQRKAAAALGIARSTLAKKLEKYFSDPNESILHRNCNATRTPIDDVKAYWIKTEDASIYVKRDNGDLSYEDMRDEIIAEMQKHSPSYDVSKFKRTGDGKHLLVIDPADIHIGKLSRLFETGEKYDIETAVARVRDGVTTLLSKAQNFGIDKILFVIGNDVIHIDHPHRRTTAGTPQDTDGQWWEMFLEAKKCYIAAIETCALVADVHIVFCPSNHDYMSGWMLADSIYSWFRNHPAVSFGDNQRNISIAHRKYVVYGNNLIGLTHGDGAKESELSNLMQFEAREAWGKTKYAYVYVHHLHHKIRKTQGLDSKKLEKDHTGITVLNSSNTVAPSDNVYVEYVRSPSPADGWHSRNGYQNQQAIEAFIHHEEYGQVARISHFF